MSFLFATLLLNETSMFDLPFLLVKLVGIAILARIGYKFFTSGHTRK